MSIVLFSPLNRSTAPTMNYSVVVLGGILVRPCILFSSEVRGVYWFKGPVKHAQGRRKTARKPRKFGEASYVDAVH